MKNLALPIDFLPPADLFAFEGWILWPCLIAISWISVLAWNQGRHQPVDWPRPSWAILLSVWACLTAAAGRRTFSAMWSVDFSDITQEMFFAMQRQTWRLCFESLMALTVIVLATGFWHRREAERRDAADQGHAVKTLERPPVSRWQMISFVALLTVLLDGGFSLSLVSSEVRTRITGLHSISDSLWIGAAKVGLDEGGLFVHQAGTDGPLERLPTGTHRIETVLEIEADLWMGGGPQVIRRPPRRELDVPWETYDAPLVRHLFEHGGWVWGGGVNPLVRWPISGQGEVTQVRILDDRSGLLRDVRVFLVVEDTLWIGARSGLFRWQPGDGARVTEQTSGLHSISAMGHHEGELWIGGYRSLHHWNPQREEAPTSLHFEDTVNAFHRSSSPLAEGPSWLWLAARDRLLRLDAAKGETFQRVRGAPGGVEVFLPTEDGDLWLGGGEGLARWDRSEDRFHSIPGVKGEVTVMRQHRDGLWIGSDHGLYRLAVPHHLDNPVGESLGRHRDTARPSAHAQRIDLGDIAHGWQRDAPLRGLATAWLITLGLIYGGLCWRHRRRHRHRGRRVTSS